MGVSGMTMHRTAATARAVLLTASFLTAAAAGLAPGPAAALDAVAAQEKVTDLIRAQVKDIEADPVIMSALTEAASGHEGHTDTDIGALDTAWREQTKTGRGPLIDPILSNAASARLRAEQARSLGLKAEIFVFCAKGLNVAQTNITSDYFQGDEAKYQETFTRGAGAIHVEPPKFDESAGTYVMTASGTLTDPATGRPVGAVTVNVDLGKL